MATKYPEPARATTVGELRAALNGLSDDLPLVSVRDSGRLRAVKLGHERQSVFLFFERSVDTSARAQAQTSAAAPSPARS